MKKIISAMLAVLLLLGAVFALASCAKPNSDPYEAEAALKKAGYDVLLVDKDALLPDDVVATITARHKDGYAIYIVYYEDADEAKDAWEDVDTEKVEEYLAENDNAVYKRTGNMIVMGDKEAVKAAR